MENKEKKIKKQNKRKISIITCFLWIFLVVTMGILVMGGINKSRALEETDETPTVEIGKNITISWSCKCKNFNGWMLFRDNIEDYCIIENVVESDNTKYLYECTIKLNKEKINDIVDEYNKKYESHDGKHCYDPDADIIDELKVYWNGEKWISEKGEYYSLCFKIPLKLVNLPASPNISNISHCMIRFKCNDELESKGRILDLDKYDFDSFEYFIVDDIVENTEDKVFEGETIPKERIPYKCTIRINENKIKDIIDIYNKKYESKYGKHYYYINNDISNFEETVYWCNHVWRGLKSIAKWSDFADIFTIPIREMTESSKEITLSYNANIDENKEQVEVPESDTQIMFDGELVAFEISNMIPVRSGYKFLGWSNNSGKNNVDYNPGENIYLTENKTIYAVWEEDKSDEKYGSYKVKHEYYVKDENGNINLEDTVVLNSKDIEVGKKVGVSSEDEIVDIELNMELIHKINDKEYTYKYLENSGNIVIEENVEKEITIKYIRDITDEPNTLDNNVDTSDINIWLYVAIFVIAVIVIVVIFMVLKNKSSKK